VSSPSPVYYTQVDGHLGPARSSPLYHPHHADLSAYLCLSTAHRLRLLTTSMNEWCINQHGKTGLTQACLDSPHTHEEVEEKVRAYLEKWIPEAGAGLLAGSSVHADMRWVLLFPSSFCPSPLSSLLPIFYRCLPLHNAMAFIAEWVLGPASNGALLIHHSKQFGRMRLTIDSSCSTCQA
jgi:hypothetical protein